MFERFVVCAGVLALNLACAGTVGPLVKAHEPTEGERARVRLVAAKDSRVLLSPGRNCVDLGAPGAGIVLENRWYNLGSRGFRGRSLGMPSAPSDADSLAEFYVEAGKPQAFLYQMSAQSGKTETSCEVGLAFVPEANQDYVVDMQFTKQFMSCSASVAPLGQPKVRVDSKRADRCDEEFPRAWSGGEESAGGKIELQREGCVHRTIALPQGNFPARLCLRNLLIGVSSYTLEIRKVHTPDEAWKDGANLMAISVDAKEALAGRSSRAGDVELTLQCTEEDDTFMGVHVGKVAHCRVTGGGRDVLRGKFSFER